MNILKLFRKPTPQERFQARIYEAARTADNLLILSGRLASITGQTPHELIRQAHNEARIGTASTEEILLARLEKYAKKPD